MPRPFALAPLFRSCRTVRRHQRASRRRRPAPIAAAIESLERRLLLFTPTDPLFPAQWHLSNTNGGFVQFEDDSFAAGTTIDPDFPTRAVDLSPDGKLYATSATTNEIRSYDATTGNLLGSFMHSGPPASDIEVGPNSVYVVTGGTGAGLGIQEFRRDGTFVVTIGASNDYISVTRSLDRLFATTGTGQVDLYSFNGTSQGAFPLGPFDIVDLSYNFQTDRLLTLNGLLQQPEEYTTDGLLLRGFSPVFGGSLIGITAGPGGGVYAVGEAAGGAKIFKWIADGNFVGETDVSSSVSFPGGIDWAGNAGGGGNNPPEGMDDEYAVDEDGTLLVPARGVLENDSDPNGDPITVAPELVSGAQNGALIVRTDGSFDYRPSGHFNGEDSFTYRVMDSNGALSDPTTVTINVRAVNDAPEAADDTYAVDKDKTLTVPAPGVLGNDRDVEDDPLTAEHFSNPANGRLTFNPDGSFVYTPNEGFTGTDSFRYRAKDSADAPSALAVVTITVSDPVMPVQIDIKPGNDRDRINANSKGKTRVAILSTPDFNAPEQVDPFVTFGKTGDEDSVVRDDEGEPQTRARDVNGDGLKDLVIQFETEKLGLQPGDTEAIFRGQTIDGTPIEGKGSVVVKAPPKQEDCLVTVKLVSISYGGDDIGNDWTFVIRARARGEEGRLQFSQTLNHGGPPEEFSDKQLSFVVPGRAGKIVDVRVIFFGEELDFPFLSRAETTASRQIPCPGRDTATLRLTIAELPSQRSTGVLEAKFEITLTAVSESGGDSSGQSAGSNASEGERSAGTQSSGTGRRANGLLPSSTTGRRDTAAPAPGDTPDEQVLEDRSQGSGRRRNGVETRPPGRDDRSSQQDERDSLRSAAAAGAIGLLRSGDLDLDLIDDVFAGELSELLAI